MDGGLFEVSFRTAVRETGRPYLEAKQTILGMHAEALPLLKAKQTPTADWKTRLTADILIGWQSQQALFDQCTRYVKGDLPGTPPITGKFSALQRARAIARLGKEVTPRLLEMLIKTHEYASTDERSALFGALVRIGDARAVHPLVEVLQSGGDDALRTSAAGALGSFHDAEATKALRVVLHDPAKFALLRATAASSLGALKDSESLSMLESLLGEKTNAFELRKAAAHAIEQIGDPKATGTLVHALTTTNDLVLLQVIVEALGTLGDRSSLEPLGRLEHHSDSHIREEAKDAREKVLDRLHAASK